MADNITLNQDNASFIKDLSKLGRNIQHTIIVDNQVENFGWHLANGICINEYIVDLQKSAGNECDEALVFLGKMLEKVCTIAE